jgi:hypothetical protein
MRRNRIVLTLLTCITASVGTAACANVGSGATGDSADGKQALTSSLSGLQAGNYTFTRADIGGAVHLPDGSLITQPGGPSVLRTGSDLYLRYSIHGAMRGRWAEIYADALAKATAKQKAEVGKALKIIDVLDGKNWVKADEMRLVAAAEEEDQSGMENLPVRPTAAAPDVTGATALIAAVTTATVDGTTITGTLDATKVDPELNLFSNDPYYFYGPKAQAMTYRATLDDQGRLTQLTVDVPGQLVNAASAAPEAFPSDAPAEAPEPPVTIAISKYGETTAPGVPQGATDLDPAAYELLTNDVD